MQRGRQLIKMPTEIEIKLVLKQEDADGLESWVSHRAMPNKAQQRSIYFDTLDHCLVKPGLSLRIRRSGRQRIQTVKNCGANAVGLFDRSRWDLSNSLCSSWTTKERR